MYVCTNVFKKDNICTKYISHVKIYNLITFLGENSNEYTIGIGVGLGVGITLLLIVIPLFLLIILILVLYQKRRRNQPLKSSRSRVSSMMTSMLHQETVSAARNIESQFNGGPNYETIRLVGFNVYTYILGFN